MAARKLSDASWCSVLGNHETVGLVSTGTSNATMACISHVEAFGRKNMPDVLERRSADMGGHPKNVYGGLPFAL